MYLNNLSAPTDSVATANLTLTWDVFKFHPLFPLYVVYPHLTLTWDVFKYKGTAFFLRPYDYLTLTWDVFIIL